MFRAGLCSARYCIREAVRRTELRQQALHRTAQYVQSHPVPMPGTAQGGMVQHSTRYTWAGERHRPGSQRRQHSGHFGGPGGSLAHWNVEHRTWAGGHGNPSLAAGVCGTLQIVGDGDGWCCRWNC